MRAIDLSANAAEIERDYPGSYLMRDDIAKSLTDEARRARVPVQETSRARSPTPQLASSPELRVDTDERRQLGA